MSFGSLVFTIISCLCDMVSQVQGLNKTFDKEKECIIISFPKSMVYKNKLAFSRMARPKSAQDSNN